MKETHVSILERTRIVMTEMVPLIREMEAAFGKEAVRHVLEQRIKNDIASAQNAPCREPDFERAKKSIDIFAEGQALDYVVLSQSDQSLGFNVTQCQYKRLMEELDAVDLGPYLICDHDFAPRTSSGHDPDSNANVYARREPLRFSLHAA